jgi:integrase
MAYRFAGKQKKLSLGKYPDLGLAAARERREAARDALAAGRDPSLEKRLAALNARVSAANTFELVAEEWLARIEADGRAPRTIRKQRWILKQALPALGARPIAEITTPEVFAVLKKVEGSGRLETARALRSSCARVFRHAIVTARATHDPCAALVGATVAPTVTHMAALFEPSEVAGLMVSIHGYRGDASTRNALAFLALTFVRSSELRFAAWQEFDLDVATWEIPGERMKMKRPHIVPLSRQAVALLRRMHAERRTDALLFPGIRSPKRPISDNTINAALRRMGYEKADMTGHGFRRIASTTLNGLGFHGDWIERQLAHIEPNKVRRAYNAAEYLPERARMMQAWADWLEDLELLG